jgi:hypothetical protein
MLRSLQIAVIADDLREPLIARGVRVWTVGYHRNPDLFRLIGEGGPEPPVWIEETKYSLFLFPPNDMAGPIGRPADVPWYGWFHDVDALDRLLRAATAGVVDEPSLLLAHRLPDLGWGDLVKPRAERRQVGEGIEMVDEDPAAARELVYYDAMKYTRWSLWHDQLPPAPDPETRRGVEVMARPNGPPRVHLAGVGDFFRETLPRATIHLSPPEPSDGWLPRVRPGFAPPPARALELAETFRYARRVPYGTPWNR